MNLKSYGMMSLVVCVLMSFNCQAEKTYTFGIVPQQSTSKLVQSWTPILNHISRSSGYTLVFKTAKNITNFERNLSTGAYDFAYMNPYHYTVFHESAGYDAILKASNKHIQGIIVVRKDSPYKKLEDLAGLHIAFPSPNAFAASMLTQAELHKRNITYIPRYVSSHDAVYQKISQHRFPAGGGVMRTLRVVESKIADQLRILWSTPEYTPHAIAAHKRVPDETRQRIQQAFIEISSSETGRALLRRIDFKGLMKASDQDWNDVRNLNLHQ